MPLGPTVIAIPARDEAQRIEHCLHSLADQRTRPGDHLPGPSFSVLVVANNCRDDTVARVRRMAATVPYRLLCHDAAAVYSHAGAARRGAMDLAANFIEELGGHDGVIMTTDADSRAQPTWIHENLQALADGADAVAGSIDFDPREAASFPVFLGNRELEAHYARLCDEIVARLDPRPHDPWPNHRWGWGASLAVRLSAYRRAGGMPAVPLAEDRAFLAALEACDARVRHSLVARVWTSSRTSGRAPGGLADLLRSFAEQPDTLCDALLEPVTLTCRRAAWRARLRSAYRSGERHFARYAARLSIPPSRAHVLPTAGPFGRLWQAIEFASPLLGRERLHPARLEREIALAGRVLGRLRRADAGRPAGTARAVPAGGSASWDRRAE